MNIVHVSAVLVFLLKTYQATISFPLAQHFSFFVRPSKRGIVTIVQLHIVRGLCSETAGLPVPLHGKSQRSMRLGDFLRMVLECGRFLLICRETHLISCKL
jgi:hypothetical protein